MDKCEWFCGTMCSGPSMRAMSLLSHLACVAGPVQLEAGRHADVQPPQALDVAHVMVPEPCMPQCSLAIGRHEHGLR
eukprot:56504-Eustigmatos_ZCMA.PRE.2